MPGGEDGLDRGAARRRLQPGGAVVATDERRDVDRLFRHEAGQAVATLIRLTGDFDLAEEVVQEAFEAAVARWPRDGVPANPGAWIVTTARNRALDRLRRERVGRQKLEAVAALEELRVDEMHEIPDDRLRLIFTCCHPSLAMEARVALTLRTVGGLTTREIARAFLVGEATVAQRLVRAKAKIRASGVPYRVPPRELLPERLDGVLAVLYLIFNEGYASTEGGLVRADLCDEAIWLVRLVDRLLPGEPEAMGLLALMLLTHARSPARTDAAGGLVLLEDQDRGRWDQDMIDEGLDVLERSMRSGSVGPYQLQAAIAAAHDRAPRPEDTDWPQIVVLYDALLHVQPTQIVALNRAVAVAMADGPGAGLPLVDAQAEALEHYHLFHSARADLLRRLGRDAEAKESYERALALATNPAERAFLEGRIRETGA
jgi:RNA polymerase sigma-70 factor (ECF subfamily)